MISLGLTGNVGAGKSAVARLLEERGAAVLDADAVVHRLLAEGGDAVPAVLAAFPDAATPDGLAVDRRALARRVFSDPDDRRKLEGILHPLVLARQHAWLDEQRRRGVPLAVVEASQLFEAWRSGGPDPRERFDRIVVVTCDEEIQVARAAARSAARGMARDEAERDARRRLAAQAPQSEKAALADHVIDNSGSLDDTAAAVDALVADLVRGG